MRCGGFVAEHKRGHDEVIQPLANPSASVAGIEDASPRIPQYCEETRIGDTSNVNRPGMDEIVTLNWLRKRISELTVGGG